MKAVFDDVETSDADRNEKSCARTENGMSHQLYGTSDVYVFTPANRIITITIVWNGPMADVYIFIGYRLFSL